MYMGLFPSILYTISLKMAYRGISEKYQCDKNPNSHENKCDKSPLQNKEDRNQLLAQTKNQKEKHTTFP